MDTEQCYQWDQDQEHGDQGDADDVAQHNVTMYVVQIRYLEKRSPFDNRFQ